MAALRVVVMGINYAPESTGIARYTTSMAVGLRERGHEVSVVTTFPHYPEWSVPPGYSGSVIREDRDGVSVTRVRHYVPSSPQGLRRLMSEISFGLKLVSRGWGRSEVMLLPSPAMISSAMVLARSQVRGRRAVGVIVQDLYSAGLSEADSAGTLSVRVLALLESWTLRHADVVAVIHERFKERVVTELGVDPARVEVIRNWTHISPLPAFDRAEFRSRLGWFEDEFVVLHTGAMGEKQGLANVVDAARIADQQGKRVRFVLMGAGGQRSQLEELSADVERLEMLDPVSDEDYPRVLASADLLLVNERKGLLETAVPSKLTSYFSTGLPVLAATEPQSTTAEEVLASGAGVLTPSGDPAGLLAAVLDLSADPERASALGAQGPAYCARLSSAHEALDAYDAMVRRLAATRPRRRTT